MDVLKEFYASIFQNHPLVGVLFLLMIADVISGCMVAAAEGKLNSTVGFRGMIRKAYMALLVVVAVILEPHAEGIPVTKFVALCFIANELMSLVENAGELGLPVPKALMDMLEKFKEPNQKGSKPVAKREKRPSDFVDVSQ